MLKLGDRQRVRLLRAAYYHFPCPNLANKPLQPALFLEAVRIRRFCMLTFAGFRYLDGLDSPAKADLETAVCSQIRWIIKAVNPIAARSRRFGIKLNRPNRTSPRLTAIGESGEAY